jgi:hypothetical protein
MSGIQQLTEAVKSLTERVDILSKDMTAITEHIAYRQAGVDKETEEILRSLAEHLKENGLSKLKGENFELIIK